MSTAPKSALSAARHGHEPAATRRRPSQMLAFMRTPAAVAGALIVTAYLVAAAGAPLFAPADPMAMANEPMSL